MGERQVSVGLERQLGNGIRTLDVIDDDRNIGVIGVSHPRYRLAIQESSQILQVIGALGRSRHGETGKRKHAHQKHNQTFLEPHVLLLLFKKSKASKR